ncbi:hypothetical protein N7445_004229, partial [Penicillium cf. griseofulvum]
TRASILVYISYIAVNIALAFLRTESLYFPTYASLARLYVYIILGILGLITLLELANYLYYNGIFSGRSTPRALILFLNLVRYSTLPIDSSVLFLALFTGPYRLTEDVDPYETTLIIATGFRIATSILYLKKIIHSYNTYTSYTRRLYLILSVYIFTTVLRPTEANKEEIGLPNYRKIILTEIKRLPNIPDKLGRTLIIVSVSDSLRDRLRDIIRGYLY